MLIDKIKKIIKKNFSAKGDKVNPIYKIFYNRSALVLGLIILALTLILIRTSIVLMGGTYTARATLTAGSETQLSLAAPRGDILAADGTVIASNEESTSLWLVQPDLSMAQLNQMLLSISNLLAEYEVPSESKLDKYFGFPETGTDRDQEETSFVFKQSPEKILRWQQNKDLFNMLLPEKAKTGRDRQRIVIEDPNKFFEWLLYDYFQIEDRSAGTSRVFSDQEAYQIMQLRYLILENNWLWSQRVPIRLASNVNEEIIQEIEGQNQRYLGVLTSKEWSRVYTPYASLMPHVLGYVGRISKNQYDALRNQGYKSSDMIGQDGVEASAERYLKGVEGLQTFNKWTGEEGESFYYPGSYGVPPQRGNTVVLTLQPNLQKVARDALQKNMNDFRSGLLSGREYNASHGVVVAFNVKTGAILAMVSLPDYNPADFLMQANDPGSAARVQSYLRDNTGKPLLNRAIAENYAPGSVFKILTSLAALESGAITTDDNNFTCLGHEEIAQLWWRCLTRPYDGHGSIPLVEAIRTSCNLYFFKLGIKTGIDNISFWAKKLGYGEVSRIDLPGEVSGIRPSRELKRLLRTRPGDKLWFPADTAQTSIGQFDNSYTALQLVRGVAGIASGKLMTPHVIGNIIADDGSVLREEQIIAQDLEIDPSHIDLITKGMLKVSQEGTGYTYQLFHDFPVKVAVKTGTAEVGDTNVNLKINSV
ncbi:MAG TPA: hypothetical protein GXX72_08135, partial [Clostridiaceae bacterium]|nr:hypothetical protein [Clostridiaceae bacterium]